MAEQDQKFTWLLRTQPVTEKPLNYIYHDNHKLRPTKHFWRLEIISIILNEQDI